jgi:hypothetical protein
MSRIGRLAGAILAETEGQYFLIGNLKEPCDFARAGFESPGEIDAQSAPYRRLKQRGGEADGPSKIAGQCLVMEREGEELARHLSACFVIKRNGSISERLWRLVTEGDEKQVVDARWLTEMPPAIWQIVQDAVLRCS